MTQLDTTCRERIFREILSANGREAMPDRLEEAFRKLLRGTASECSPLSPIPDPVGTFLAQAGKGGCVLERIDQVSELPALLAGRIAEGESAAVALQSTLQGLRWPFDVVPDHRQTRWGIACAEAAIAETGTLVVSSREVPSGLLFLVDRLVLVIDRERIVPRQEQAWQALGVAAGNGARAVHLITGPSRTADVEQTLQIGAHGPRELLVVMSG